MPLPTDIVIALPVEARRRAHDFYVAALGLEAFGDELHDDGLPEPLQFRLREGATLMLIPARGFGWVLGGATVAAPGTNECLLTFTAASREEVDALAERFGAAGGSVLSAPEAKPWGYTTTVADPDGHAWQVLAEVPFS